MCSGSDSYNCYYADNGAVDDVLQYEEQARQAGSVDAAGIQLREVSDALLYLVDSVANIHCGNFGGRLDTVSGKYNDEP
jgi:hypothetical protein